MARYTGPTTRINRRFGQAIFAPTKAFERKPHPPGQHGLACAVNSATTQSA